MRILNYGSLNIDYVYSVPHFVKAGETLAACRLTVHDGGKGLNQSLALARAGAQVYHAGKVGKGADRLPALLRASGVDTSHLVSSGCDNGHAIIQVDDRGSNCILLYPGSNHAITTDEIDACLASFGEGDCLLLQNETNQIPYLIDRAYEQGLFIALNPSPITQELFAYPLNKISLFICNEIEGAALAGTDEPEQILSRLRVQYPAARVLLTLGEKGALYADGRRPVLRQTIFPVRTVDTTAAGDTFTGYFLAAMAAGKPAEEGLREAAMASSIAVSRPGAAPSIPCAQEVRERLESL